MYHLRKKIFYDRVLTLFLLLSVCLLVVYFFKRVNQFDYDWNWAEVPWSDYPHYILETVKIAAFSCLAGIVIGIPFGIVKGLRIPTLHWTSALYIQIFRGIPLLVQIFMLWLFSRMLFEIGNYGAAILALGFYASFKVGEIIEKSLLWYHQKTSLKERIEDDEDSAPSRSGLLKRCCIMFSYLFVHLIRESSLVSLVAVHELFKFTRTSFGIESLFIAAAIYCIMIVGLTQLLRVIRKPLIKDEEFFNSPANVTLW